MTSLNNRRVPPTSCAVASRLQLSRQNSLRAQTTVVGALHRVSSSLVAGSRSLGSPSSVTVKTPDVSATASSFKTEDSDATSSPHDDADDEDDDVRHYDD